MIDIWDVLWGRNVPAEQLDISMAQVHAHARNVRRLEALLSAEQQRKITGKWLMDVITYDVTYIGEIVLIMVPFQLSQSLANSWILLTGYIDSLDILIVFF